MINRFNPANTNRKPQGSVPLNSRNSRKRNSSSPEEGFGAKKARLAVSDAPSTTKANRAKPQPYNDFIEQSVVKLHGHLIKLIDGINSLSPEHVEKFEVNESFIRSITSRTVFKTTETLSTMKPDLRPAKGSEKQLFSTLLEKLMMNRPINVPETIADELSTELTCTIQRVTYLLNRELRENTIPFLMEAIADGIESVCNQNRI